MQTIPKEFLVVSFRRLFISEKNGKKKERENGMRKWDKARQALGKNKISSGTIPTTTIILPIIISYNTHFLKRDR